MHEPTIDASWPTDVCSAPGISPVFSFSIAASSNDRLRNIRRYISADVSGATSMTISPALGCTTMLLLTVAVCNRVPGRANQPIPLTSRNVQRPGWPPSWPVWPAVSRPRSTKSTICPA